VLRGLVGLPFVVCAGCGVPVSFSRTVDFDIPFGPVDPACTAISGSGTIDDQSFSFSHQQDASGACVLSTIGSGSFVDLAAVRQQAGPHAEGSTIDGVIASVSQVALRNGNAPLAARSIDGSVDVLGQERVIVVHDSSATTHVSDALVRALDDAWQNNASVTGNATSTVSLDAGEAIENPALHLELQLQVQGTASLGG
jgi:hypothetical protein